MTITPCALPVHTHIRHSPLLAKLLLLTQVPTPCPVLVLPLSARRTGTRGYTPYRLCRVVPPFCLAAGRGGRRAARAARLVPAFTRLRSFIMAGRRAISQGGYQRSVGRASPRYYYLLSSCTYPTSFLLVVFTERETPGGEGRLLTRVKIGEHPGRILRQFSLRVQQTTLL